MTASEVMDDAAVLLNDSAKDVYTYAVQLPYLKMAFDKLASKLKNAGIPLLSEVSADVTVSAGATTLLTGPSDIVAVKRVFEKAVADPDTNYIQMDELNWEPLVAQTDTLRFWVWREGEVKLLGATTGRKVRLQYKKSLTSPTTQSSVITIPDSKLYLAYETAAIIAGLGGGNFERQDILSKQAETFADELIGVAAKSKQSLGYRRRPFRQRSAAW